MKAKRQQKWYLAKKNSSVYIQGFPKDISIEEVKRFFLKAGIFRIDVETGEERIKLYADKETGELKGDGLITFANEESVEFAVNILGGKEIRPGFPLNIEPARFEQKGDYRPREKKEIDELARIKWRANMEKLVGWAEPDEQSDGLRIVILRGIFAQSDFDEKTREDFFGLLEDDIKIDFEEKFGPIKRILIFENHPDGVVQVKFERSADAETCVKSVNGRLYNGHPVECFYWDGKTNYKVVPETEEQQQKRIDEFGKWLTGQIDSEKLFENLK